MPLRPKNTAEEHAFKTLIDVTHRLEPLRAYLVSAEAMTYSADDCLARMPYMPPPASAPTPPPDTPPPPPPSTPPLDPPLDPDHFWPDRDADPPDEVERRTILGRLFTFVQYAVDANRCALEAYDRIMHELRTELARVRTLRDTQPRPSTRADAPDPGPDNGDPG